MKRNFKIRKLRSEKVLESPFRTWVRIPPPPPFIVFEIHADDFLYHRFFYYLDHREEYDIGGCDDVKFEGREGLPKKRWQGFSKHT
jgi:hypothetical protein